MDSKIVAPAGNPAAPSQPRTGGGGILPAVSAAAAGLRGPGNIITLAVQGSGGPGVAVSASSSSTQPSVGTTIASAIATPSGGTQTTAHVLTGAQTAQLLQKLRAMNSAGGGGGVGASPGVKIQVQAASGAGPTATTAAVSAGMGIRQIVIPIQSASSGGGAAANILAGSSPASNGTRPKPAISSPLKVIRLPGSLLTAPISVSGSGGIEGLVGSNVKVIKASSAVFSAAAAAAAAGGSAGQIITTIKQQVPIVTKASTAPSTPSGGASSEARKRSEIDFDAFGDVKRRKADKGGKGLRHFSMKVCEKVQAKGTTTYNEVADELVNELTDPGCASPTDQQYDQKNIRRRVYDALNVLMAMNIISKEKKEIRWLGLPTNSIQEANSLESDKAQRMERIRVKTQQLQDLILQQIAFKNLVERNREREKGEGPPALNSAIQLPFIIVNTSKKTVIDCSISNDKMEYLFNFDDTFEIHDDMEVLKRMGLGFGLERGSVKPEDLEKARKMVPRALENYVVQMAEKGPGHVARMPRVSSPKALQLEPTFSEQTRFRKGQQKQQPLLSSFSSALDNADLDNSDTDSDGDIN